MPLAQYLKNAASEPRIKISLEDWTGLTLPWQGNSRAKNQAAAFRELLASFEKGPTQRVSIKVKRERRERERKGE